MAAFAIYRFPYGQSCHIDVQTAGEPEELAMVNGLSGKQGFVIAPFATDKHHPLLLLHPDWSLELTPEALIEDKGVLPPEIADTLASPAARPAHEPVRYATKGHYEIDFANFHAQVKEGEFNKIVLARSCREKNDSGLSPVQLFAKACEAYPRMMVALVSAERCGTWLMATPEILLEQDGDRWTTMALAGTMPLDEARRDFDCPPVPGIHSGDFGWSEKNIQEQRFVSTYVMECLEQVTKDFEMRGPYSVRAGNLVHLRSDFYFSLADDDDLGALLETLYPTPAVCGLPKEAARDFICSDEYSPRGYYSGFVGPLGMDVGTRLFVSLRCMRFEGDECCLYAGGGLVADSNMEEEWRETEDKMETMRMLLRPHVLG